MGFCGQCGAKAGDEDKFCRSRGQKLPVASEGEVFCFACNARCSRMVQWSQWTIYVPQEPEQASGPPPQPHVEESPADVACLEESPALAAHADKHIGRGILW